LWYAFFISMRNIDKIIIHCSATPEGRPHTAADIRGWHVVGNGWSDIGYHFVVGINGELEYGRPLEKSGAHTKGHNKTSIGICYIGGLDKDGKTAKDTRTCEQKETLVDLLMLLKRLHPNATIHGHRDFSSKSCPSYDATKEYISL